jgi:hypothetical protein
MVVPMKFYLFFGNDLSRPSPGRDFRFPRFSLMPRFFVVILATVLFSHPGAAGQVESPVVLSDFEDASPGWTYYGGYEFKGAQGRCAVDQEERKSGNSSLRLDADFTGGGSYVAAVKKHHAHAANLRFWVKAPGVTALDLRVKDSSDQVFQHRVPLEATDDWQQVTLENFSETEGFWGGPKDGVWYSPLREVMIMLPRNAITGEEKKATIWIDDVTFEEEPVVKPAAMKGGPSLSEDTIFGFCSHMIHTDFFYGPGRMGPYWRMEHILPWVVDGRFGVMREAIYQPFFVPKAPGAVQERSEETLRANREMVESYLDVYGKAGVRVVLCPMFERVGQNNFDAFFEWLATLPEKYPAVIGFEMHNEPHLKHFGGWQGGEYAAAVKRGAAILKKEAPDTPVLIGSMSHLWWGPAVKFFQTAVAKGALDSADGITVHPYRKDQPPEGGAMRQPEDDPCGLETEVIDFWAMVQRANSGGKPLELHLTEFGYSSGIGQGSFAPGQSTGVGNRELQADYLTRIMLLFFDLRLRGIPLQGLYWYDLKADRNNPLDMEANFGVIDYDASAARPAYTAYARLAGMFERTSHWWTRPERAVFSPHGEVVKSYVWERLTDGALILPFWRLNQLQKESGDFDSTLSLALPQDFRPGRVVLHDLSDKTTRELDVSAKNGSLSVPVTVRNRAAWLEILPDPPLARAVEGPWRHELPAEFAVASGGRLKISGPREIELGADLELELVLENSGGTTPLEVTFRLADQSVHLRADAGGSTRSEVILATEGTDEARLGAYLVESGGKVIGRGDFFVVVRDPLRVRPAVLDASGRISLEIQNVGATRLLPLKTLSWTSENQSGSTEIGRTLKPGEEYLATADYVPTKPYEERPVRIRLEVEGRQPVVRESLVSYAPLHRVEVAVDGSIEEWKDRAAIDLSLGKVEMKSPDPALRYEGPDDLSGSLWIGGDDTHFHLAAAVVDNKHHQPESGEKVFLGDNIQFGISTLPKEGMGDWHEFGLSLTANGPEVWRWVGPEGAKTGPVSSAKAVVRREGTTTYYECSIPWKELEPVTGTMEAVGFSVLVNDNDGVKRKGWIEWGSGIGRDKNPSLYRALQKEKK